MSRKSTQAEVNSSTSDEESYEEESEGSETSSDDDEFDSEDERVKMIPDLPIEQTVTQAAKVSTKESSSESDDATMEPAVTASQQQNIKKFEPDMESEYDTESSSDSEEQIQVTPDDGVLKNAVDVMETPVASGKNKLKEAESERDLVVNDNLSSKTKSNSTNQLNKDATRSKSAKGKILERVQGNDAVSNGHGAMVDMVGDGSAAKDGKLVTVTKKRKLESSQDDAGRGLIDSSPVLRKSRDEKSVSKKSNKSEASPTQKQTGTNKPSTTSKVADKDKDSHNVEKELAKKTLNSMNARDHGSTVSVDVKGFAKGQNPTNQSNSPFKQKKLPHVWSVDEEIILAHELVNHVKMGFEVPSKRNSEFWGPLSEILHENLGIELSKEQVSEKTRRLKQKYQSILQKIEESQESRKAFHYKNGDEQRLFDILNRVWGRAETMELEDQPEVDSDRNDLNSSIQTSDRKDKRTNLGSVNLSAKALNGKIAVPAFADNANAIPATSIPEQEQIGKEDPGKDNFCTPGGSSTLLMNNVERVFEEKIHATLEDLLDWTKKNLEEWMTKTYALIENSVRRFEDQVQSTSGMFKGGEDLSMSLSNPMENRFLQGENRYQKQWQELRLQELNVYSQRLELMRLECELKQERIKVHLQQLPIEK